MPFNDAMKNNIITYCTRDFPNNKWYEDSLNFIKDFTLKARLICEFKNARFIYKMFEGLASRDEFLLAEVRMQVLMYASIYEATLH